MNAIELKNVNFSYDGKVQILENVNIALNYGEVNLISGHSGEGKSTLLYIISGIIPKGIIFLENIVHFPILGNENLK